MFRQVCFRHFIFLYAVLCTYSASSDATIVDDRHRTFQYNKPADDTGTYNFAYDTGSKNAHSMRMEHRDDHGIVRGRYGYTDPHGKLRMVEYEAGPGGFKARGDVGPDLSPHEIAPASKPTNLQLIGWDPEKNPMDDGVHVRRFEPVVAVPISDDHPVKGYQAPIPIVQKSEPIVAVPISADHPVKGQPVPIVQKHEDITFVETPKHPVSIKTVPKPVAVVAPIRVDHPEKGYPVPIVKDHYHSPQKSIDVVAPVRMEHHVKGDPHPVARIVETPPKSIAVVAPIRADHPEKGHPVPVRIEQDHHDYHPPQKSIDIVAPVRVDHRMKGDPHPVVARVVEPPVKSVAVVAPVRMDHPEKGYDGHKHVKTARLEYDRHVDVFEPPPKSVAVVSQVKTAPHVEKVYSAPAKSVALVQQDHPVKGYVAPHDRHLDRVVHAPPKSVSVVAPLVDHKTKGYVTRSRYSDGHQHIENIYGPWVSKDHSYRPRKSSPVVVTKGDPDHHHHERPVGYYAVSSGKQRHYHTVGRNHNEVRPYPISEVEVDHSHGHYHTKTKDHDHPTYQRIKSPISKYHKHDGHNVAVVDRHSEITATDKHGRIVDHYHQRLEPLTIRNIDVDPNSIRVAGHPASSHHHHSSASDRSSVRVVTDVSVESDVAVRGRSVVARSATSRTSSSTSHSDDSHVSRPRSVSFIPGNRYRPGTFTFQ